MISELHRNPLKHGLCIYNAGKTASEDSECATTDEIATDVTADLKE